MKVIECFAIEVWDGGDRHNFAFHLATWALVDEYMKTNIHDNARPVTLVVFETLDELVANSNEKLRKSALAKLSAMEKKALGLGDK